MRAQAGAVPAVCMLLGSLAVAVSPAAAAREPLGVVEQTLGRFDRDTLTPVGPRIDVAEPHTAPVLSPGGDRLAMGVSAPASPQAGPAGRVGLWIVDPSRMLVLHAVQTGIAAEAVAYPGVVAALLQNGTLVIVDPETGAIIRRHSIGYSDCSPSAVQVGGRAVFVNEVRRDGVVEMAVVGARGHVRTAELPLDVAASGGGCRVVPLVADPAGRRVFLVGSSRVAVVDVVTRRATFHPIGDSGFRRTAARLPGDGLAVAGNRGLRVLDTRTWTLRWRDRRARSVLVSGTTVLASGRGVRARDAADGRVRWTVAGEGTAAAAVVGRVYVSSLRELRILDVATGRLRGRRSPVLTAIRLA